MPARKHDRIRLGVASLVWGFDLSEQRALEVFLKDASDIGYEGVLVFDMTVQPWLDRPDEFKALLARYELDFTGAILRPTLDFAGTERLTKFMAAAGAEVMNVSGRDDPGRVEHCDPGASATRRDRSRKRHSGRLPAPHRLDRRNHGGIRATVGRH